MLPAKRLPAPEQQQAGHLHIQLGELAQQFHQHGAPGDLAFDHHDDVIDRL